MKIKTKETWTMEISISLDQIEQIKNGFSITTDCGFKADEKDFYFTIMLAKDEEIDEA